MKLAALFLLILLYAFWQQQQTRPPALNTEDISLVRTGMNNCQDKEKCFVVYLAPWCGACKQITPALKQLLQQQVANPQAGMQVIVGEGRSAGDNERLAREMGSDTVIDSDRHYHQLLSVRYYPTMLVIDQSNKISLSDQAAFTWAQREFLKP